MDIEIYTGDSQVDCEWAREDTPSGVPLIHIRIGTLKISMDAMTWDAMMQARKEWKAKSKE